MRLRPILALALLLIGASAGAQPSPAGPPPGRMVEVFGHAMHIHCTGARSDGPTVILEAGGGGHSQSWAKVQERLPPTIRACAYDRAGQGHSAPGPAPRTMQQEAFELHALLEAAGIDGPYIYAGQSIGGILARVYDREYPGEIAGFVLVDPSDEDNMLFSLARNGWFKLRELSTGKTVPDPVETGVPPGAAYDPATDFQGEEAQALFEARQRVPQPFADRPLVVLGAGRRPTPPGTDEQFYEGVRQSREANLEALAGLSARGKFVRVAEATHNIHQDQPQAVADAIAEVYREVAR